MSDSSLSARPSRLPALARAAGRAVLHALPTVAGVILLSFFLMQAIPGDAADVIAAESGSATADSMAATRKHFGLDLPMLQQLGNYLHHLARFDLGLSPRYNTPVVDLIASRLGNTALLMSTALGTALLAGLVLGTVMASFVGRWPDRLLSLAALLLYSTPGFWLGLMAIILLSVQLGWLPPGGVGTLGGDARGLAHVLDVARHLVLPTLALAGFYVAIFARLTRASMLEVSRQDFVRTARAKGVAPLPVTLRHILRNALMPVLTVAGLNFGTLLGGAVVVETVFSWPGLGRLAYESVMARDYVVLMGILILSSLLVIIANIVVDLAQTALDPRVRAR
ncbi:ABC transporter permease [Pseudomonadota bacterium AL_CKDN230030165-1A_HGKHYDSX7]